MRCKGGEGAVPREVGREIVLEILATPSKQAQYSLKYSKRIHAAQLCSTNPSTHQSINPITFFSATTAFFSARTGFVTPYTEDDWIVGLLD